MQSGTFTVRNLTRRLLATATVIYLKGVGTPEDTLDEDEPEDEEHEAEKAGKAEISISATTRIPFVKIALFPPRTIPSVRTLASPELHFGAAGGFSNFGPGISTVELAVDARGAGGGVARNCRRRFRGAIRKSCAR